MVKLIDSLSSVGEVISSLYRKRSLSTIFTGAAILGVVAAPLVLRAENNGDPIVKEYYQYLPIIVKDPKNLITLKDDGGTDVWGMNYSHFKVQANEQLPEGAKLVFDVSVTDGKVVDIYSGDADCNFKPEGGYPTTCKGEPAKKDNAIDITVATNTSFPGEVVIEGYSYAQGADGAVLQDEVRTDNNIKKIVK